MRRFQSRSWSCTALRRRPRAANSDPALHRRTAAAGPPSGHRRRTNRDRARRRRRRHRRPDMPAGWVHTADGRILPVAGAPPMPADAEFPDAIVVPGFVDMRARRGGVVRRRQRRRHRPCGRVSTGTAPLASLVTTGPAGALRRGRFGRATRDGVVAGIHLGAVAEPSAVQSATTPDACPGSLRSSRCSRRRRRLVGWSRWHPEVARKRAASGASVTPKWLS